MTRFVPRRVPTAAVVLCLAMAAAVSLLAHLQVAKTFPAANAKVGSPDHLQVWFTQEPDPAVSALELVGASGPVTIGKTEAAGGKSLRSTVTVTLPAGAYTVKWRTAGDDGHVMRGEFGFTVE